VTTIVLNELESIREEDKEQMVRQEHQHQHEYEQQEGGRSGGKGRVAKTTCQPKNPEPTNLGLAVHHLPLEDDDEPCRQASPPNSVIEHLTMLSNQLESAVELSCSLQVQSTWSQR
jgi:hypothetical protein